MHRVCIAASTKLGPDHGTDHGPDHGSDHGRKKCFKEKKYEIDYKIIRIKKEIKVENLNMLNE